MDETTGVILDELEQVQVERETVDMVSLAFNVTCDYLRLN